MSKTTVVLNDKLLEKAMKITKAKTKKAVIEQGLMELVKSKNTELLREELGSYDIDLTLDELERLRSEK